MFEPDEKMITRARMTASQLIEATEAAIALGLEVPVENHRVFQGVYGWWRLVNRSAAAVLSLAEQGFAFPEVAPLMRSILNHTYAINWLVDNGEPAVDAVISYGHDEQDRMAGWLERTDWGIAAQYRAQIALRTPEPTRTVDEQARHKKLVGEIRNVAGLLEAYGSGDVYPVYALLSGLSHTSINTASAYLSRRDDGAVAYLPAADSLGGAALIQLAVALIQTGLAVSPLLTGNPMREALDKGISDLGMQDTQFLPRRAK